MPTFKQSSLSFSTHVVNRMVLFGVLGLIPSLGAFAQQVEPAQFQDPADIRAMASPLAPVPDDTELNGLRGIGEDRRSILESADTAGGTLTQMQHSGAASNAPVITNAPITNAPITNAPITNAPITNAPITNSPITRTPITNAPAVSSGQNPQRTFASPRQFENPASGSPARVPVSDTTTLPPISLSDAQMPRGPEPSNSARRYEASAYQNSPAQYQPLNNTPVVQSGGIGYQDDSGRVQPAAYQQSGLTMQAPRGQTAQAPIQTGRGNTQPATSSELQLELARSILDTFSIDAVTEPLPGRPVQLVDFLQVTPLQQRQQMINQYWETYYDWANFRNATEYLRALQTIQAPQDQSQRVLLNAARSNAGNEVLESEIQLVKSQSILQEFLTPGAPASSGSILPLPSDTPLIQRFETHYEWYSSRGRVPQRLLGFDLVLPKALQLISDRAETVRTARAAWNQSKTARGGVPQMLEAARLWKETQQELIKSVVSYNRALADYSLAISPINSSSDQVIAMLISKPEPEIPAATPQQRTAGNRINTSSVLQNQNSGRGQAGGFGGQQVRNPVQNTNFQNSGLPARNASTSLDPQGVSPLAGGNPLAPVRQSGQQNSGGFAPPADVRSNIGNAGAAGADTSPASASGFTQDDLTTRRGTLPRDETSGGLVPGAGGGGFGAPVNRSAQNPLGPAPSQRSFEPGGTDFGGGVSSGGDSGSSGGGIPSPPPSRSGSGGSFGGGFGG
ncbi:MAG: hypothetical protein AAF456_12670 [Planctomycetota bacterium]